MRNQALWVNTGSSEKAEPLPGAELPLEIRRGEHPAGDQIVAQAGDQPRLETGQDPIGVARAHDLPVEWPCPGAARGKGHRWVEQPAGATTGR